MTTTAAVVVAAERPPSRRSRASIPSLVLRLQVGISLVAFLVPAAAGARRRRVVAGG